MIQTETEKDRIIHYWSGRSAGFRKQREADLRSPRHRFWEEELRSQLPGKEKLDILDAGCGCGFFSLILADMGHRVTGIDLTEDMVEEGRKLAGKYGAAVDLRQMDAEHPLFPDGSFDVVVSRNLTWTLPHLDQAYAQWLRVLRPGGLLLNYDAEHARYHLQNGLKGEKAHSMLTGDQMEECLEIYRMLPVSRWRRPRRDMQILKDLGCRDVTSWSGQGMDTPYPVFRIRAVKV